MIVYCHSLTSRLKYVTDFISQYFSHPFKLTANEQAYISSTDFKINYSYHRISRDEIYIKPCPILTENEKRRYEVHPFQHNGYTAFFKSEGDMEFDLFASIFYLLSRYEEYLPHQKDALGNFSHQSSLAFKEGFLHQPLVNIWLEDFRHYLQEKFPDIELGSAQFKAVSTYNIDSAWCYQNKGFGYSALNITKAIFSGNWKVAAKHIKVLRKKLPDPHHAYPWLEELREAFNMDAIYFFLLAAEASRHDHNIDINNPAYQGLIKQVATKNKVGLHPSWASNTDSHLIVKEKSFLEALIEHPVPISRQHLISFNLPLTYHKLQNAGITSEYSMGYATINGFRASVATPFFWYDLEQEETTNLLIYPFCFTDTAAQQHQHLSAEQAYNELLQYYEAVKAVNGTLITVWHNTLLGPDEDLEEWRTAYYNFLKTVC